MGGGCCVDAAVMEGEGAPGAPGRSPGREGAKYGGRSAPAGAEPNEFTKCRGSAGGRRQSGRSSRGMFGELLRILWERGRNA